LGPSIIAAAIIDGKFKAEDCRLRILLIEAVVP